MEKLEDENLKNIENYVYDVICKKIGINKEKIKNKIKIENVKNLAEIEKLGEKQMAIYIFFHRGKCLKIGKVWSNSNPRFKYQHYNPKSSKSNLANSILKDIEFCKKEKINENEVRKWIVDNLQRINIIINKDIVDKEKIYFLLNLLEAFLHYEFMPKYEGYKSQR